MVRPALQRLHNEKGNVIVAQKKEDNMLGNVIERLQKMETFINSLSKPSETPNGDRAEVKVDRIADIIWAELNGTSASNPTAAISSIKRGVRIAMNEFYRGPYDRSDTAFKADQVELTSARNRILELEVQLNSSLEIEKSARQEHARISEELVEHERTNETLSKIIKKNDRDYAEAMIMNDGQATTILQLQRQLENATAMIENVRLVLDNDFVVEVDKPRAGFMTDYENELAIRQDMDGPNYAAADDDDAA